MKIQFERTGGFTGIHLAVTVDTTTLPREEEQELEALIQASHFCDLPAVVTAAEGGADRFTYQLTVVAGSKSHTVQISEPAVSEPLQVLIQKLTLLARSRRR